MALIQRAVFAVRVRATRLPRLHYLPPVIVVHCVPAARTSPKSMTLIPGGKIQLKLQLGKSFYVRSSFKKRACASGRGGERNPVGRAGALPGSGRSGRPADRWTPTVLDCWKPCHRVSRLRAANASTCRIKGHSLCDQCVHDRFGPEMNGNIFIGRERIFLPNGGAK